MSQPDPHPLLAYAAMAWEREDLIELRRFPQGRGSQQRPRCTWQMAGAMAQMLDTLAEDNAAKYNVYAGILPRTEMGGKTDATVEGGRMVWADFDGPGLTHEAVFKRAVTLGGMPKPSMFVASGHGFHMFWKLDAFTPKAALCDLVKDTALYLDTDPSVANPSRILRLPGFTNWKEPVAACELLGIDAEAVYSFAELRACVPQRQQPARPTAAAAARAGDASPQDRCGLVRRATAYVKTIPGEVKGNLRNAGFKVGVILRNDYGLTLEESLPIIESWNTRNSPPLMPEELIEALENGAKHGKKAPGCLAASRSSAARDASQDEESVDEASQPLANYTSEQTGEGKDAKEAHHAIHIQKIANRVLGDHGPDLGRVGQNLFAARGRPDDLGARVAFLNSHHTFFGWAHAKYPAVKWRRNLDANGHSFVTEQQFYEYLLTRVRAYRGVSSHPFAPHQHAVFTRWSPPEGYEPDGGKLWEFADFFNPASEADAILICAFILTLFWGGPAGKRPLFVIAPEEQGSQQGIGKTELATNCARLVGGYMDLAIPRRGSFADGLAKQALEEVNLPYRMGLIDNHTGTLRDDSFTKLITAPKIGGRASYAKQAERANLITWVITTNEPNMSTDIASRMVMIRLKPCDRANNPDWPERIRAFLRAHADEVAADALWMLTREDKQRPTIHSRFPDWDMHVLGCLPKPDDILRHIAKTSASSDRDVEEIQDFLFALAEAHTCMRGVTMTLKTSDLVEVWNTLHSTRQFTPQQVSTALKNAAAHGSLTCPTGETVLEPFRTNTERGWKWRSWMCHFGDDHASPVTHGSVTESSRSSSSEDFEAQGAGSDA